MISKLEKDILSYIVIECKDGYKVIDFDDFDFLSKSHTHHKLDIKSILENLDSNNFIQIKYIDDFKCCVIATAKTKQLFSDEIDKKYEHKKTRFGIFCLTLLIFVLSLLGSLLGTFFYFLLFGSYVR